mmetsp:Transcript_24389/g.20494  ORF Transcript_24389/g.20494 Transcript_24389/m.20494 type:complete len:151 (+) Transcript_24389:371-823(+)
MICTLIGLRSCLQTKLRSGHMNGLVTALAWNHFSRHQPRKSTTFFALTLKLREGFDAFAMLSSKGIGPASTTSWEAVKMALEGTYGHKVEVGCNFDKAGKRQLLEVRTCYQPVLGKIEAIDCPNEGSAVQCGSPTAPIVIPPFHPALYSK